MQIIDGGNAIGIIDATTNMLTEGYAVLERDEYGKAVLEAYFRPYITEYYVNGVIDNKLTFFHKSPFALLVPIINRPDAKRPFGHSRISRACMNLTQSALRTLLRSEVSAEFYSVPQKYILGLSENAEFNNRAAELSSFLSFGRDEDGNNPILGQFNQQSMAPHLEQLRTIASVFVGETGLTLDDLGFTSSNPSSSEAIRASHENLRLSARKSQKTFGTGFVNAGFLVVCTVTLENGRERQDVWSKKKWQVSTALEVPYQPFYAEKNQAENLQKNQLAKYIGLDKSVIDTNQTEMRDFIKQTKQNRDYFKEQNCLKKKLLTDSVKSDKKYVDKYFWDGIIKKNRKNTLSVPVSDSIPETITNKVNSAINKIAKKFPIIKEQVSNIKYGELDNAYGLCSFNTGNSINEITLLKSLFSDEDTLIKILHHDFETKKSYETDSIESLVAHELGHALHSILALKRTGLKYGKRMNSFEAIAFGNERNKIIQEIYCLYFTDENYEEILDECERQLGKMARNPDEMIAQAFGNYYYGTKKQPLSEVIVKYFRKELK